MRFEASGRLIIQWPANAGSGALNAEGRAAFPFEAMAQALESRQLALQTSERVHGLHPDLVEIPTTIQAERVKNTAILQSPPKAPESEICPRLFECVAG